MRTLCLSLVAWSLMATDAVAIEPLTANELKEICTDVDLAPEKSESRPCITYVKGFLDGAVATDARVAENVVSEYDKEETFSERAIRTRIIDRLNRFGPSVYAEFCVGQPDPIADVVQHVIEEFELYDNLEGVQAQQVVYASLRRHYPCDKEQP
jgi:hypothetical protein